MRRLTPCIALTFSLTVSFLPGAYSQTTTSSQPQDVLQSNQTLRTNTRLVVVDVVATDSNGQPVSDLKASDLTVLEDGKPQKISAFSYQREKAASVVASSATAGAFTNAPQYKNASSMNVILLDALNGNLAGHAYGRDQLLRFLDKGTLTQPTALYALEEKLTLLHDFTTDIKGLRSLVQDYKPKGAAHVQDAARVNRVYFAVPGPDGSAKPWPTQGYKVYAMLRDRVHGFESVAAFAERPISSGRGAAARRLDGVVVTPSFMTVLGARPALGRFFDSSEERDENEHRSSDRAQMRDEITVSERPPRRAVETEVFSLNAVGLRE